MKNHSHRWVPLPKERAHIAGECRCSCGAYAIPVCESVSPDGKRCLRPVDPWHEIHEGASGTWRDQPVRSSADSGTDPS